MSFGFVTNESSNWVFRWPGCARPSRPDSNFSKRPTPTETDRTTNRCARTSPAGGEIDRILLASRTLRGRHERTSGLRCLFPQLGAILRTKRQRIMARWASSLKFLANGFALSTAALLKNDRRHEAIP